VPIWMPASFPFRSADRRFAAMVRTMGSSTPWAIHVSFLCTWPTISFLRARKAAVCSCVVLALFSCDRIGCGCGRAMGSCLDVVRLGGAFDRDFVPSPIFDGLKSLQARNDTSNCSRDWARTIGSEG
jgi:hypothetical protein